MDFRGCAHRQGAFIRDKLHFIRVYTVCKGKKDLKTKEYNFKKKKLPDTPRYIQWTIPSLLYQNEGRIQKYMKVYILIHLLM